MFLYFISFNMYSIFVIKDIYLSIASVCMQCLWWKLHSEYYFLS